MITCKEMTLQETYVQKFEHIATLNYTLGSKSVYALISHNTLVAH